MVATASGVVLHKKCPFAAMGDNVVVIPKEVKMIGQIAVPDNADIPEEGEVVAVGPGLWHGTAYAPMECKIGDTVMLYSDRPFERIREDGVEYWCIRQVYLRLKRA